MWQMGGQDSSLEQCTCFVMHMTQVPAWSPLHGGNFGVAVSFLFSLFLSLFYGGRGGERAVSLEQ